LGSVVAPPRVDRGKVDLVVVHGAEEGGGLLLEAGQAAAQLDGGAHQAVGGAGHAAHLVGGLARRLGGFGGCIGELAEDEDLGGDAGLVGVGRHGRNDFRGQAGDAGAAPGGGGVGRRGGDGGKGGVQQVEAEEVGRHGLADDFRGDAVGRDGHWVKLLWKFTWQ
jgi:hypothetical protein